MYVIWNYKEELNVSFHHNTIDLAFFHFPIPLSKPPTSSAGFPPAR